jgi:hypothetical protein
LLLTLLASWLIAHHLEARARFRRISATLVALGAAALLGFLWIPLFRLGLWIPVSVALAADACLIVMFYRSRKASAQ